MLGPDPDDADERHTGAPARSSGHSVDHADLPKSNSLQALKEPGSQVEFGDQPAATHPSRPGRTRSLLAMLGGAVAIGMFFGSLVIAHNDAVVNGAVIPSASWLRSWPDWLPMVCIGYGCARLFGFFDRGRTAFRGFAIGSVFALSLWHARFEPVLPWLLEATGALLGIVLGLHGNSARRSGWAGLALVALASSVAVAASAGLPDANQALAVALIATLLSLCIDERPYDGPANPGHMRLFRGALWLLIASGLVWLGCSASVLYAPLVTALAVVVMACVPAGRLAIAMGATAAACCVPNFEALRSMAGIGELAASSQQVAGDAVAAPVMQRTQLLGRAGPATAVYVRSSQEMQLQLHGEVLSAAGPDRTEEPLLAAVCLALLRAGDRVRMIGVGTGRAAAALGESDACELEVAAQWSALEGLLPLVAVDGPIAPPAGLHDGIGSEALAELADLPDGSRQFLLLPELPCTATSFRATDSYQRQLRRVVGNGLVCQSIALDRVPVARLRQWFAVVARVHAWNGVYAVGNAAVLVSASRPPQLRDRGRGDHNRSAGERWAYHEAHLGDPSELNRALLGTVRVELAPSASAAQGVVELLLKALASTASTNADSPQHTPKLLAYWQGQQAAIRTAENRIRTLANDAASRDQAQTIASRFLPMGAPSALLQAALGVSGGGDGEVTLRAPGLASRCAYALDPTFFAACPPALFDLPRPNQARGDLEGVFRVEPNLRLVDRCLGNTPQAVALRARFPSRCARALCVALKQGPLVADQSLALRELSDPFVLAEAARVLLPANRLQELLTYWRADLPMPRALQALAQSGTPSQLKLLVQGLRGHTDTDSCDTIAYFLVSDDPELCASAGTALRLAVGDRIPFDPQWPRSRRLDAASRLRALHNRKP